MFQQPDHRTSAAACPGQGIQRNSRPHSKIKCDTPRAIVAYPTQGGPPLRICRILCSVSWTGDGKFIYVYLLGTSQGNAAGKTFIIPLQPGNPFPQLPTTGVGSEGDLTALPGVKTAEGVVSPGPDVSHYAFTKQSVHRNLYRIPTP
jgi:hypothetical protein